MILVLFRRSLFLGPYTVHLFSNTNTWENNYNYDAAHDDDDDDDDADDDDDVYAGGHPPTAASLAVDSVSAANKHQLGKAMCILQTYCYTHTADKYTMSTTSRATLSTTFSVVSSLSTYVSSGQALMKWQQLAEIQMC